MRRLYLLLFVAILSATLLSAADDKPLARGVKGEVEDIILVGADDWHASVAATGGVFPADSVWSAHP